MHAVRYPYNAEARLRNLTDTWITPVGKHFVRNHCSVPDIEPETYRLTVAGVGVNTVTFTLNDLKTKFPRVEIASVIQCNGNRREDFHYLRDDVPAFGPPHWVAGAIGNSRSSPLAHPALHLCNTFNAQVGRRAHARPVQGGGAGR